MPAVKFSRDTDSGSALAEAQRPDETRPRLWLLDGREDSSDDLCARLAQQLDGAGFHVTLQRSSAEPEPAWILALLPPREGLSVTSLEAAYQAFPARFIPMVVGSTPSPVFGHLSQIVTPAADMSRAVQQIALLTQASGVERLEVDEWVNRARAWSRAGRPRRALELHRDLGGLTSALRTAGRIGHSAAPELADYLRECTAAARRRSRRFAITSAVAATSLVAFSGLALGARTNQSAAATAADLRAAESASSRFVRLADEALRSGTDPDLPYLLVGEALRSKATDQAITMARRVLDAIPEHVSIPLGESAAQVATSLDGSRIAVTLSTGAVQVRGADGALLQSLEPTADGNGSPSRTVLSPDGTRLAILAHRTRVFREGEQSQDVDLGGTPLTGWFRDDVLMVVTTTGLTTVDGAGQVETVTTLLPSTLGPAVAADVTPDGKTVAVTDGTRLWVGRTDGSATVVDSAPGDIAGVVLDHSATWIALIHGTAKNALLSLTGSKLTPSISDQASYARGPEGVLVTIRRDGRACLFQPEVGHEYFCPPAHVGALKTSAPLGRGGMVTAGSDGFLRLWRGIPIPKSPNAFAIAPDRIPNKDSSTVAWRRSRVEVDRTTGTGAVLVYPAGTAVTFSTADFTQIRSTFLKIPAGQYGIALSPGGHFIGQAWQEGSTLALDLATMKVRWTSTVAPPASATLAVVIDRAGNSIVAASPHEAQQWLSDGTTRKVSLRGDPVQALIGREGSVTAVDKAGETYRLGPDTGSSSLVAFPSCSGETAAMDVDASGRGYRVLSNGALITCNNTSATPLTLLPESLRAFAAKVDDDGRRLALFGPSETLVLDTSSGEPLLHTFDRSWVGPIDDLTFLDEERVLAVTHAGVLTVRTLASSSTIADRVSAAVPRAPTADEIHVFGLPEGSR